jgi:hypothetical protein
VTVPLALPEPPNPHSAQPDSNVSAIAAIATLARVRAGRGENQRGERRRGLRAFIG